MSHKVPEDTAPREVFEDKVVQLAAICPICALAALSPAAALSALSPVLNLFNPALNPAAALLAFVTAPPVHAAPLSFSPHQATRQRVQSRIHRSLLKGLI